MLKSNISIIGGAGHVGFPLGLAFAEAGITLVALLSTFIEVNSKLEG